LELDLDALLAQFPGTQIYFEHAEANRPSRWVTAFHPSQPHNCSVVYHRLRTVRLLSPGFPITWPVRRRLLTG
jgi:hypothetical protein